MAFWNKKQEVKQLPPIEIKSVTLPEVTPRWKLSGLKGQTRTDWCTKTAIEEGYNQSVVTFACIEKRAKLAASVPWVVYEKRGGELEKAETSPISNAYRLAEPRAIV